MKLLGMEGGGILVSLPFKGYFFHSDCELFSTQVYHFYILFKPNNGTLGKLCSLNQTPLGA